MHKELLQILGYPAPAIEIVEVKHIKTFVDGEKLIDVIVKQPEPCTDGCYSQRRHQVVIYPERYIGLFNKHGEQIAPV